MTGRNLLDAAPAAGARMNKAKIVKIAVVAVLAILLLTAAALSMAYYAGAQLHASLGSDNFLMLCVVTHLTTISVMARYAATAPTLDERRYHANSAAASSVHLAANLYFAIVARHKTVQDAA